MDSALNQLEKVVLLNSDAVSTMPHSPGYENDSRMQKEVKFLPMITPLVRVLTGMQSPSERVQVKDFKLFDQSLNPSQHEAIRFCLGSPEVACIHGPPGMRCVLD